MGVIDLTLAGGKYDRVEPLISEEVRPEGINLNYVPLEPDEIFWRMLRYKEFDGSEMSLGAYVILRSRGINDFIAIPVFASRTFRHSSIYVRADSDIKIVKDLAGGKIGMPEFQMTMAIWVRGILSSEYGLNLKDVTWYLGGIDKPGRKERIELRTNRYKLVYEQKRSLSELLLNGEIDALMSARMPKEFVDGNRMRRLFDNYRKEEMDYYSRTGIVPIMHLVVLKKELLDKHPWVATSLYKAYEKAMGMAIDRVYNTDALPVSMVWMSDYIEQEKQFFGNNLARVWSNGLEDNRHILQTFINYLQEEDLLERLITVDDLFAENLRESYSF